MSTVPHRKKSVVGMPSIDRDVPQPTNQLNKSASSVSSLYQQCSQLRTRLLRIHGFAPFFALSSSPLAASSRQSHSTDPVAQLWDTFALGSPLCYLYNLVPDRPPLSGIVTEPDLVDVENVKEKKRATAKFIIALTEMRNAGLWQGDVFTVGDLLSDSRDTNGFVKVVSAVTKIVDMLPTEAFKPEEAPPSPPLLNMSAEAMAGGGTPGLPSASEYERERNQIIRELIETERKYVGDLEVMREYATALAAQGIIDHDTIHHLFPGLNKLLDFQRQFLILLEGIYEQPWHQQRWGHAFTSKEEEFVVYEPYCANYTNAAELLLVEEQNLMALCDMINPRSELPAFLIKPVQRICKYPLLLQELVKKVGPDYPFRDELVEGVGSAKRIADKVNEAQRREENMQTVKLLEQRVEDWKGHHLSHFGHLLLDEIFFVTKSEVDREYHVFLFEKIILCCKEAIPGGLGLQNGTTRKGSKSNSYLKKNMTAQEKAALAAATSGMAGKKRMTPLLLKGRIFLNNVTAATPSRKDGKDNHSLQVWWKGDEDIEYFTLKCRTEEQLKQWETTINKLISQKDSPKRQRPPPSATASSYTTSQTARGRYPSMGNHPPQSFGNHPPAASYGGEFPVTPATPAGAYPPAMVGLGIRERVDSRATDATATDEENWTGEGGYDSPYGSSSIPSGRATPSGARRPHASMPVQQRMPGQGANSLPMPAINTRHTLQRAGSDMSFASGPGPKPPVMRSQFSSTRLRSAYEEQNGGKQPQMPALTSQQARLRSASSPTAYAGATVDANPAHPPPPPIPPINTWSSAAPTVVSATTPVDEKRGSGSSQSTDVSSGFSGSQATSPVTPYGSNDSNLQSLRPQRGEDGLSFNPPVKVKVHFREDLFVIVVQRSIEYDELMEKVGKKIRLCGARHDGGQFRVRYQDEDGDMISLASNDDLQIALDSSSVVLYVM